jgi:WD40 repeat protein
MADFSAKVTKHPHRRPKSTAVWLFFGLLLAGSAFHFAFAWRSASSDHEANEQPLGETKFFLHPDFVVHELPHTGVINSLAFSPDGNYVAAGSKYSDFFAAGSAGQWDGDLILWDLATRKKHASVRLPQWVCWLSFSPNGKALAVTCSSSNLSAPVGFAHFVQQPAEVHIYDFPAMNLRKKIRVPMLASSAIYSPDGKQLAIVCDRHEKASGPSEIILLDSEQYEERRVITGSRNLPSIAFSPDSREILSSNRDTHFSGKGEVHVHEVATGKSLPNVGGKTLPGEQLLVVQDSILMSRRLGIVEFFDYRANRFPLEMSGQIAKTGTSAGFIAWADITPDAKHLLVIKTKGKKEGSRSMVLWEDYNSKELTTVFEMPNDPVVFSRCAISPNARTFAVGTSLFHGIRGKHDDPRRGHVLLFEKKADVK